MEEMDLPIEEDLEEREVSTQPLRNVHLNAEEAVAVVAGPVYLDIVPTLNSTNVTIAPGRFLQANQTEFTASGSMTYTGLALHKLGITTRLIGKVGVDLFGQAIMRSIEAYGTGLTGGMIMEKGESSSYKLRLQPAKGSAMTLYTPGCNDTFEADDLYYELLEKAALFHFGSPPLMAKMYEDNGAQLRLMFERAKATGVTTTLDFALPYPDSPAEKVDWSAVLRETLPFVDVFLPSVEELLFALRRPLFEKLSNKVNAHTTFIDLVSPDLVAELGAQFLEMGARIVALKMGHRGLYLCTADGPALEELGRAQPTKISHWVKRQLWAPCFSVDVANTLGAGDATVAGFLFGLLRGMGPEATLSVACAVGASSVEMADALSGIKSWPEIMERIATGWSRLLPGGKVRPPLDLAKAGWRWHETQELWLGPQDVLYSQSRR